MKFNTRLSLKNPGRSFVMIALLGAALSFSSCKTDVEQPQEVAALSITNAAPALASLDFVVEGTKVNNTPLLFGQNIDYVRAYPGKRNGAVYAAGTTTKSLYSANFNLTARAYHSLYILPQGDSLSYLLVMDEFKVPATDKAQVRFANLSPNSPSYNLELQGDTTTFSDRAYKTLTPYKYVKPAIFKVLLRNKTTNEIVASVENVELKANRYYTIWAKGLAGTDVEAQKLGIKVTEQFN